MSRTKSIYLALLAVLLSPVATADPVPFAIGGSYTQGAGSEDLLDTTIDLGGAGSFTLDPGGSNLDFFFTGPGAGTFCTNGSQIDDHYFLDSFAAGDTIAAETCGTDVSADDDWDTILVSNEALGVWGTSHSGFLGFVTSSSLYGWISYDFVRSEGMSTITFLSGAYDEESIVAGEVSLPEPGTLALLGLGLVGMAARRRKTV